MIEMNPYYARESEVGPVFDVATFSRRKAVMIGLCGLVFAALVGGGALYVWNPTWIMPHPPHALAEAQRDVVNLWRDYPQATLMGVATAGSLAAMFVIMACSYLYQSFTVEMYIRVGEGGISFCVPRGFRALAFDLRWDEIVKLTVTQQRQVGSLSRNAGNLGGQITMRTRSHGNLYICLNDFREPAHLIYDRIRDAKATRPAELVGSC